MNYSSVMWFIGLDSVGYTAFLYSSLPSNGHNDFPGKDCRKHHKALQKCDDHHGGVGAAGNHCPQIQPGTW